MTPTATARLDRSATTGSLSSLFAETSRASRALRNYERLSGPNSPANALVGTRSVLADFDRTRKATQVATRLAALAPTRAAISQVETIHRRASVSATRHGAEAAAIGSQLSARQRLATTTAVSAPLAGIASQAAELARGPVNLPGTLGQVISAPSGAPLFLAANHASVAALARFDPGRIGPFTGGMPASLLADFSRLGRVTAPWAAQASGLANWTAHSARQRRDIERAMSHQLGTSLVGRLGPFPRIDPRLPRIDVPLDAEGAPSKPDRSEAEAELGSEELLNEGSARIEPAAPGELLRWLDENPLWMYRRWQAVYANAERVDQDELRNQFYGVLLSSASLAASVISFQPMSFVISLGWAGQAWNGLLIMMRRIDR
jgi:hypothetical protein